MFGWCCHTNYHVNAVLIDIIVKINQIDENAANAL